MSLLSAISSRNFNMPAFFVSRKSAKSSLQFLHSSKFPSYAFGIMDFSGK